ncbi:hypothetical protein M513_05749 [Trichuris suis]|uniref:BZIP domain-containing protein n=1 Tax=Trichuris suis TaxID=68888 RepID=A0A085M7S2_9BILA|nr:hypothetical protein M513_05749 [Trichuris suis]
MKLQSVIPFAFANNYHCALYDCSDTDAFAIAVQLFYGHMQLIHPCSNCANLGRRTTFRRRGFAGDVLLTTIFRLRASGMMLSQATVSTATGHSIGKRKTFYSPSHNTADARRQLTTTCNFQRKLSGQQIQRELCYSLNIQIVRACGQGYCRLNSHVGICRHLKGSLLYQGFFRVQVMLPLELPLRHSEEVHPVNAPKSSSAASCPRRCNWLNCDLRYREKRERNNEAVRRSRMKRRNLELEKQAQVELLRAENEELESRVAQLRQQLSDLECSIRMAPKPCISQG